MSSTKASTAMSSLSKETLELIASWAEILTVVLALASAFCGIVLVIASKPLKKIEARENEVLQGKVTDAQIGLGVQQERAAKAEKELKEVDAKTEGFRLAIATANERAAKTQASLALAEQHSSEANAKAEGFRRDIAQANERAAEANRIAEQERLARLQIEARLADRTLSPVHEQRIETAFAPLQGKTVDVAILGDTMEIAQFSTVIITAMRKAGVLLILSHPIGGPSVRGVLVGVKSDAPVEFKKTADEFIAILKQSGNGAGSWDFDQLVSGGAATVSQDQGATAGSPLRIFIGSK
jgi:hypothetical protein